VNVLEHENINETEEFDLDEILKLLDEPTVQLDKASIPSFSEDPMMELPAQEPPVRETLVQETPVCDEEIPISDFDYNALVAELETATAKPETENELTSHQAAEPIAQKDIPAKDTPAEEAPKMPLGKTVLLYLHDMLFLLVAVVVVLSVCFRMVIVDGGSMYNTLVDNDYLLLLSNVIYHEPQAGDIVVISKDSFRNGEPIVKRVIATEGQTVNIDFSTGTVYVDGQALVEPYIYSPTTNPEGMSFPLVVEDGCIFVMGDNRGRSKDSRDPEIGLIDVREVMGKAVFLLIPGDNNGTEERDFSRFGVIS
jgi:signal peptidase I